MTSEKTVEQNWEINKVEINGIDLSGGIAHMFVLGCERGGERSRARRAASTGGSVRARTRARLRS